MGSYVSNFSLGPIGWAMYLLCALPIGYGHYNRKIPGLRLSAACNGMIDKKATNGWIGNIIDIFMILGLVVRFNKTLTFK